MFFRICIFLLVFILPQSWAQNNTGAVTLSLTETAYSILERADWRRFDNGRYTGLVNQEIRAHIIPVQAGDSGGRALFQGNFFVMQNTLRDMRQAARAVDAVIPVVFEIDDDGFMLMENDRGFPVLRGFPAFPAEPVRPGSRWQAPGRRAVDPLNTGYPLIIPFVAEYEYRGTEVYLGTLVHRIHANYASRYVNEILPETDLQLEGIIRLGSSFQRIQGSHRVEILLRVEDGLPIFMRDNLDVMYTMTDGSTVRFTGFTLTFGQGIVPMDRVQLIASIENVFSIEEQVTDTPEVHVDDTPEDQADDPLIVFTDTAIDVVPVPEGIRLTIRDIRYAPDSAEFLPEERYRLDLIADALRQIPDRTFLVEGHTAAVGLPTGEMQLSIERAERMIEELVRRGISADSFIYHGWGGTRPIADNSTDAGRSQNRRVEITILE